jgi:hypothetical protein
MHPDLNYAVAKSHQHEMLRHADAARKAKELQTSRSLPQIRITLPRMGFARHIAAVRARIAQA